jgi:hypothetical protein
VVIGAGMLVQEWCRNVAGMLQRITILLYLLKTE